MAKTFLESVYHRRSTRKYLPEDISAETVKKCLETATLAPNSSNMQLWEFVHVTDRTMLQKIAKLCFGQSAAATAPQMVVFLTRQDLYKPRAEQVLELETQNILKNSPKHRQKKRIADRKKYYGVVMPFLYAKGMGLVGLARKILISFVGLLRPSYYQVSEADMRVVVHKSCALAAQTFMLAMAAEGLDTCPMEGFDSFRVKEALDLPDGSEINMIISCGLRDEDGVHGDRVRIPFEQVYRRV